MLAFALAPGWPCFGPSWPCFEQEVRPEACWFRPPEPEFFYDPMKSASFKYLSSICFKYLSCFLFQRWCLKLEEGIFCLAVSWIKPRNLLVEFASWRRYVWTGFVCAISLPSLKLSGICWDHNQWWCLELPSRSCECLLCFEIQGKDVGETPSVGIYSVSDGTGIVLSALGPSMEWYFFYRNVKLFPTRGYGWSKVWLLENNQTRV